MAYDYDHDEAPTDEARTNEEAYEEMQQQFGYSKYPPELKGMVMGNGGQCVFFNEEGLEDEEDESSEEDEEEEEGEFDPALMGQHIEITGDEEY